MTLISPLTELHLPLNIPKIQKVACDNIIDTMTFNFTIVGKHVEHVLCR